MIPVRELRIGNYLNDETWGTMKVNAIFGTTARAYLHTLDEDYLADFSLDAVTPIPLSEDWLLKFGFIQQGKRKMWVRGKVAVIIHDWDEAKEYYVAFKDIGNVVYHTQFKCPYVHTLQNAFALTGEDLVIKQSLTPLNK